MFKPFLRLAEKLNIEVVPSKTEAYDFSEKTWEEIVKNTKPLKEKNFYWSFVPKKPFFKKEKLWPPPSGIKVKVQLTSEYIEGINPGISKKILEKLRNGKFAIQATLNIRGLTVVEAEVALEEFFYDAIVKGLSCVLIIHGRGLCSKKEPVLKNLVKSWLERGPYRRYILCFCSARPCDGGPGATYVLLSSKPLKKVKHRCF
ncbi:MAG: hypothetical protein GXO57_03110 [Thermodesulfobacteria bacterium]|nr:hypothetical protein [Thermodesulfobacteriota bacterium]